MVPEKCAISHMKRYDMARRKDDIGFSVDPLDDFEAPRVEPLNSTTGEQWEFDGISEDGRQAFMFGFYRDPSFAFFGTGNLRFYLEFSFANGSRYAVVEYAEESIIERCPGHGTRGTWRGQGRAYMFEISEDMSQAKVIMDSPEAKGTITLTSIVPPKNADNNIWPSANGSTMPIPFFHWVEPIPVANAELDAVLNGEHISWTGIGGHERLWGAFSWYTCVDSMTAVRFRAGSYALSLIQFGSNRDIGILVPSVIMVENGNTIFSTRRTEPSETEDYLLLRKTYEGSGTTTKTLVDKVTGIEIILTSPSRNQTWAFWMTHLNIGFEYGFGEGVGSTGYSGVVRGGLAGAKESEGPAFSEIMKFPQKTFLLAKNYVV
ncbi:hypothetical protein GGR54DRAFT_645606 [Hypoxylon sp. NC1633]|nr:hypothetical protein GGR54DRAFT_645606 [Hypoxylon sp. NC1633]